MNKRSVATFPNNSSKSGGEKTPLNLWGAKNATSALDWSAVNARIVTCALAAAASADAAVMIGVAQGGRGVVLTVFLGSQRAKTYAGSVEELESLLLEMIESLSSSSEDLYQAFGLVAE